MGVVPNRLDVVVDVRVDMRTTLFVVDASLHNVKQVRDHTARRKTLASIVEVESPGIRKTSCKDLKCPACRMISPDSTIDELAIFLFVSGMANV